MNKGKRSWPVISMLLDVHGHRQQQSVTPTAPTPAPATRAHCTRPFASEDAQPSPANPGWADKAFYRHTELPGSDKQGCSWISGVNLSHHLLLDTSLGLQKRLLQLTEEIL